MTPHPTAEQPGTGAQPDRPADPEHSDDYAQGTDPNHPLRQWLRRRRRALDERPRLRVLFKVLVGLVGGLIVAIGLVLVPLPGPGWLVVFLGLAVLGTEFHWARRLNLMLKGLLDRFWAWWRQRRERNRAGRR